MTNPSARLDNTAQCSYNNITVYKPVCWNWQTRRTQNPLVVTPCGFDPRHRHKKRSSLTVSRSGSFFLSPLFFLLVPVLDLAGALLQQVGGSQVGNVQLDGEG